MTRAGLAPPVVSGVAVPGVGPAEADVLELPGRLGDGAIEGLDAGLEVGLLEAEGLTWDAQVTALVGARPLGRVGRATSARLDKLELPGIPAQQPTVVHAPPTASAVAGQAGLRATAFGPAGALRR